jgi:hypothetical protein
LVGRDKLPRPVRTRQIVAEVGHRARTNLA